MPQPVVFEHYEVLTRDDGSLHELGRGAMGVTYKAFDTSLRVPVALKVINATYLDNEIARQRFVREAQSAAKLRHRNVATVYHLGTEGTDWFYAMEFIDGETVDALVRRHGPLDPALAMQIAAQVCRALNAAMPHSLVHRDIKPANLMLVREDEELMVKVIDFGLALSIRGEEANLEAGFVGTPHFASPEQLTNQDVDVRSDLYSLGITLWFMLAGRTPFSGTVKQVARHHLSTPPPFDQVRQLPEPVVAVLNKVLEKDRARRHQTPQELRRALEDTITQIEGDGSAAALETKLGDLLDETHGSAAETLFEAGNLIAGRYKILKSAGETNTGRAFRCYDREHQRDVKVLVLHAEITGPAYTQLEREVEKVAPVVHENLLRIYEFATVDLISFVVMEWTEGFTLLELLRARRELAAAETLALLQQTSLGVDHALKAGLTNLDFALHQIAIHFPQTIDREKLLRTPLLTWPPFSVKVNPLGTSPELAASSQTWAGGQTMVQSAPAAAEGMDARVHSVQALAAVAYELLGGATSPLQSAITRTADGHRYTPIATLSEEGNEVLKRALNPEQSFASAGEFYTALKSLEVLGVRPATVLAPSLSLSAAELAANPRASRRTAAPPSQRATPPPPAPRRRIPVKFIGGLLTVVAIGASVYFLAPRGEPDAPSSSSIAGDVTPEAPAVKPPPTTPAPVDRAALLRDAITAAETAETGGDPVEAIGAWLRVAREFPESDTPRRRLDFVIDPLRQRPELQKPVAFAPLKPLLVEAAQLDSLSAVQLLGDALQSVNEREAAAWYAVAAARGRPEAAAQLGRLYARGIDGAQDFATAFYYYSVAAEANDLSAKTALAECYLLGKGTKADVPRGLKWLKEAADLGSLRAINRLADAYNRGLYGLPTNYPEAFRLWAKVTEAKDPTGEFRQPIGEANGNLGTLYLSGRGTALDEARAVGFFQEGVRLGDPGSMFYLGVCTVEGTAGLPRNVTEGQRLIVRGAEGNHGGAQKWCRQNQVPFTVK